jgi:hypothetical protein
MLSQSIKEANISITKYSTPIYPINEKIKDKKLRSRLQKLQNRFGEVAYTSARSEMLLSEEKGYLEVEGMEKTYKVTQKQIRAEVDVTTAQKVCIPVTSGLTIGF